jgi:hypothetical protein
MTTMDHARLRLRIERLLEPRLKTKEAHEAYCKVGLLKGPYSALHPKLIIGIVGRKDLVERTEKWLSRCNGFIKSVRPRGSKPDVELNKDLFPDFPGANLAFQVELATPKSYQQFIKQAEIAALDRKKQVQFVDGLLNIVEEKIRLMLEENQTNPHLIVCVIDDVMYEYGHAAGSYHMRIKKRKPEEEMQLDLFKDFDALELLAYVPSKTDPFYMDLRNALKKRVMNPSIGLPIQLLLESTLESNSPHSQNDATIAWNLCAGITYKAGNIPWVLEGFESDTSFLGISFYHKKDYYRDDVFTSMAHIYANNYDGLILQGKKAEYIIDEETNTRKPYLTYEQARFLSEEWIKSFERIRQSKPKRVVVHKTSKFEDGEIRGISETFDSLNLVYDLTTIKKSTLRIIRHGDYPVARGSYLEVDNNRAYLYTKGYIPELDTYPGVHVPAPFEVTRAKGDTSIRELCGEILALTKLNWNTADFCCGLPITIGFASNVGRILREFDGSEGNEPQSAYKYYM